MVSKTVAIDIVQYLQKEENLSVDEVAHAMGTTPDHIKDVLKNKASFDTPNINHCVKFLNLHFWEFALAAIPINHLPEKAKNRIFLCRDLSEQLKKKKNKR